MEQTIEEVSGEGTGKETIIIIIIINGRIILIFSLAGWSTESRQSIGVVGKLAGQRLDGDVAPEARIGRTPHLAHAAFSEKDTDLVAPESRTV